MTDQPHIGADTTQLKRDRTRANIGPGKIQYGRNQRFANDDGAGKNLPFTQPVHDQDPEAQRP